MEEFRGDAVLDEDIKIIFNDILISLFNDIEPDYKNNCMKGLTLNDCVKKAKEKGYKDGTILVISESWLSGAIYRYNNYGKQEWYKVGSMVGFA